MKTRIGPVNGAKEKTLSGVLRQAILGPKVLLPELADRAEVDIRQIANFLAGERPLPSDSIDRLGKLLKLDLQMPKPWPIEKIRIRRIYGTLTPAQMNDMKKKRKLIEKELPELVRRNQLAHDAAKENTISGTLRRAIPTCGIMFADLAGRSEVDMGEISDFLCGERPLPSDAMDRLVTVLKLKLTVSKPKPRRAKAS